MDWNEACSKIGTGSKSGWRASAKAGVNTLDALSPIFAPFAARWDAEADRRRQLRTPENLKKLLDAQKAHNAARSTAATAKSQRTAARKASKNPLSAARRAAATADRAGHRHQVEARGKLKTAKREYPATLTALAVRAHAAHTVPAGFASWLLSTPADWATWPATMSAGLIAGHAAALLLGRRTVSTAVADDDATAEERQLMKRLDPAHWVQHADDRGLAGTVTTPPKLTPAGIVAQVRLDGRWSVKELRSRADAVRALLGMRTGTRMEIGEGLQGDWAMILVRTRSAADGMSMTWTPDHAGIGVDEVTGDVVDLPLSPGLHILLAGITGMGKSVSWRPLVMRAVADDEWTAVVIDPKRQEAIGWQHCLRCVGQEPNREKRMADIYAMAQELTREMHRRQGMATGATWVPDGRPENRKLLVVIDEGAAIVRMAKQKQYADVMDLFEELWSEARSVGFQFLWATQFPTKSVGVPAAVKENMSARLSLTVGAGEAERAIFGENAQQTGWLPSTLEGIPGRAMVQHGKRPPNPVGIWFVPDETVAALPADEPWYSPRATAVDPGPGGGLSLVKDGGTEVPAPRPESGPETNRGRVLRAVRDGATTNAAVVEATGINKGNVSRAIAALIKAGDVVRAEDGTLTAATAEEASA